VNAIKVFNISKVFNNKKKVAKKEKLLLLYCKHFLGLETGALQAGSFTCPL